MNVRERAGALQEPKNTATSGKKVAVIGSGAAALTAAYYLAKKGRHAVTLFESSSELGGRMRTAIPEYVLPRKVLDAEIESLSKLGIKIKTQSKVESVDKLLKEDYNAVFLDIAGMTESAKAGQP